MKLQFVSQLLLGTITAFFLLACQKDIANKNGMESISANGNKNSLQSEKTNTFYGPQMQLGDGKVRTFYTVTHTNVPVEIGFEMTAGALQGLPEDVVQLTSPFHKQATESTPFTHVLFDWNPHGHEPGFYEIPHFDFHFYTISEAERMAISASDPKMDQLPAMQYWPTGFVPTPGGVPQMGKHWVNPSSPEISGGQTFNHTMIYGSYGGKFIFVEPMITRAFLLSGQRVSLPYGQPAQFTTTNTYYPTTYNIYPKDGKYYISLNNFVKR